MVIQTLCNGGGESAKMSPSFGLRSNCVINLSPNKEAVLKEAYRVLKVFCYLASRNNIMVLLYVSLDWRRDVFQ